MTIGPEVGDVAPAFNMTTDGEGEISLEKLRGNPIVLYFYPKDDTPGCTKEALAFTSLLDEFDKIGVAVVGVSKDTCASHAKFRDKYMLEHVLASDNDGTVCDAYGVWIIKNMYGRKSMGIRRSTFLIDKKGTIIKVWRKVSVENHAEDVLQAAKSLS